MQRARSIARFGQSSAIFLLGLLIAGVYGAVLSDPDATLRLDQDRAPALDIDGIALSGGLEPPPGTERQAWYRSGAGTVVNPLLSIVYPSISTWLGLPIDTLSRLAASAVPYVDLAGLAPAAGQTDIRPISSLDIARSVGSWLARPVETSGFLIQAFADSIRSGASNAPTFGLEPVFKLGPDGEVHARPSSAEAMDLYFDAVDYDLESVRSGLEFVPRRYVATLPPDLDSLESAGERKQLFIKAVLPVILRVNESLAADRERLSRIAKRIARGRTVSMVDQVWLDEQYVRYEVESGNIKELFRRIDIIPPSLALAQAAEESGWGTSRFAREGNALFGQYTDPDGQGIEPQSRDAAGKYRIRSYNTLYDTVSSYAFNLNQHRAYEKFRTLRAELRANDATLDGHRLAGTLSRYSERGKGYIKTIRSIMRENALGHFDDVRLNENTVTLDDDRGPGRPS